MKCFVCGEQIRDDAHFCPYCGKNQDERPAQTLCLHCGKAIAPGAKFCGYCGGDQSQQPVNVAVEEPAEMEEPVVQQAPAVETEAVAVEEAEIPAVTEEAPARSVPEENPDLVPVVPIEEHLFAQNPAPAPYRHEQAPVYPTQNVVQPVYQMPAVRPALELPTDRGVVKYFLLGLITLLIYPAAIMSRISGEINIVASRYDGKRTMHFLGMTILAPLTLMIYVFVWYHQLCQRMGDELLRRRIRYQFGAASYWIWNVVWPFLFAAAGAVAAYVMFTMNVSTTYLPLVCIAAGVIGSVGMFVFFHKFFKTMNLINADYNEKG